MNSKTNKVIFSVYQNSKSASENYKNHFETLERLGGLAKGVIEVEGCYNGTKELSILLESTNFKTYVKQIEMALQIARDYNQETILEVSNDNRAFLRRTDNIVLKSGVFKSTSLAEAIKQDAFTFNPFNNTYWIVEWDFEKGII